MGFLYIAPATCLAAAILRELRRCGATFPMKLAGDT
jgi:hypothetical protein